jgi:hypothetical protein
MQRLRWQPASRSQIDIQVAPLGVLAFSEPFDFLVRRRNRRRSTYTPKRVAGTAVGLRGAACVLRAPAQMIEGDRGVPSEACAKTPCIRLVVSTIADGAWSRRGTLEDPLPTVVMAVP